MGETENKNSASKENWFTGVKSEFNKIIWPTKESLTRQTAAVIAVSVIVGLIIAVLDFGIQELVNILVNL